MAKITDYDPRRRGPEPDPARTVVPASVSVLIPCRSGGDLLVESVGRISRQRWPVPIDLLLVDTGSPSDELEALRALGARVESIPPEEFDHGRTRDRAASLTSGEILVFLNQDALPADDDWLSRLVAPFSEPDPPAAVQGAIRELPVGKLAEIGGHRFFWDSCGPRFYFTRESVGWIERHGGIGFSTVNCAIARWAWEQQPLGPAPILEDKLWQRRASERGWRIAEAPEALVWHTHDYDLHSLVRRCASEGFGWRSVGQRYPLRRALTDLVRAEVWREWRRGRSNGELARPAEILFPLLRPLALWWGNRWSRRVLH